MKSEQGPTFVSLFHIRRHIAHSLRYGLFVIAHETELVLSLMAYMFTAGVKLMGYPRKKLPSSKGGKLQNCLRKRPRSEVVAVGQSPSSSAILVSACVLFVCTSLGLVPRFFLSKICITLFKCLIQKGAGNCDRAV